MQNGLPEYRAAHLFYQIQFIEKLLIITFVKT